MILVCLSVFTFSQLPVQQAADAAACCTSAMMSCVAWFTELFYHRTSVFTEIFTKALLLSSVVELCVLFLD